MDNSDSAHANEEYNTSESSKTNDSDKKDPDQGESTQLSENSTLSEQYDSLPGTIEDEDTVSEVQSLLSSVETLESELEAAQNESDRIQSQLEQERTEFQNYRSQRDEKQDEIRTKALKDVFEELVAVRTNLTRALANDHDSIEGLRDGVRLTLEQFDDVLESENVSIVSPETGDSIDPSQHEIIRRVETDSSQNTIVEVHEPGYVFGDTLLEPAKVTVSE